MLRAGTARALLRRAASPSVTRRVELQASCSRKLCTAAAASSSSSSSSSLQSSSCSSSHAGGFRGFSRSATRVSQRMPSTQQGSSYHRSTAPVVMPRSRGNGQRTSLTSRNWSPSGRFHSVARPAAALPDHEKLEMPALSPSMETGNLAKWLVKEGDEIKAGDVLAEVETDKATVAWEATEPGYMAKIVIQEGTQAVAVGQLACIIVENQEDVAAFKDFAAGGGDAAPAASQSNSSKADAESAPAKPAAEPSPAASSSAPVDLPDHEVLEMPALSPTMATGNLARWLKKEGDEVSPGDVLAEVETDKATVAWESVEAGFMAKILIPEGTEGVAVGAAACVVAESADAVAAFANYKHGDKAQASGSPPSTAAAAADTSKPATKTDSGTAKAKPRRTGGRIFASPKARRIARDKGIDIADVEGTGPRGRILVADVEDYKGPSTSAEPKMVVERLDQQASTATAASAPAAAAAPKVTAASLPQRAGASAEDYVDVPNSMVRKVIAQRLSQSKQTVPHYQVSVDVSIDKLLKTRSFLNSQLDASEKISVNDFIVKACALALKDVPGVNSSWTDEAIRMYNYVDICVAVATDGGLITPIVADADKKGLKTIAANTKDLAKRARDNKLQPHEYQGGTFTISNLGMYGVTQFNAIINPPQSAILAVGGPQKRLVPRDVDPESNDAPFTTNTSITVTMSADHRSVDGAMNAEWLQAFKKYIEDPMQMLL